MLRISVAPARASSLAGGPGSQMSSQTVRPTRCVADVDHRRRRGRPGSSAARRTRRSWAGGPCGRSRAPAPSREHGGGVVDVLGALGEADDRDDPVAPRAASSLQRARRVGEEVLAQQQVLGRVAGERELGEQHELGAGRARPRDARARSRSALPAMSPTVAFIWQRARRTSARAGAAPGASAPVGRSVRCSAAALLVRRRGLRWRAAWRRSRTPAARASEHDRPLEVSRAIASSSGSAS